MLGGAGAVVEQRRESAGQVLFRGGVRDDRAAPERERAAATRSAPQRHLGARAAVEERLRALCAEAGELATKLPVSDRARTLFAGAALALLPR